MKEAEDVRLGTQNTLDLIRVTKDRGYQVLIDIMLGIVEQSEHRLMNLSAGADPNLLRDLHTHARASRTILEQFQIRVNTVVQNFEENE